MSLYVIAWMDAGTKEIKLGNFWMMSLRFVHKKALYTFIHHFGFNLKKKNAFTINATTQHTAKTIVLGFFACKCHVV